MQCAGPCKGLAEDNMQNTAENIQRLEDGIQHSAGLRKEALS